MREREGQKRTRGTRKKKTPRKRTKRRRKTTGSRRRWRRRNRKQGRVIGRGVCVEITRKRQNNVKGGEGTEQSFGG